MLSLLFAPHALEKSTAAPARDERTNVILGHKGDLPPDALAAFLAELTLQVADAGEPFQATDVLDPKKPLPIARFISAQQTGCDRLIVNYERGGIAHFRESALLERSGGRWVVRYLQQPR